MVMVVAFGKVDYFICEGEIQRQTSKYPSMIGQVCLCVVEILETHLAIDLFLLAIV